MKLVDVHAHLDSRRFEKDLGEVISRFKKSGGEFILTSGVNHSSNRKILEISKKFPLVKLSFGVYPLDALKKDLGSKEFGYLRDIEPFDVDEELKWIYENRDSCLGIGEVGLDYNFPEFNDYKSKQIENFEKVIALAKKLNLPLIVHSRKAEEDSVLILEKNNCEKVVMHCFNGRKSLIKKGIEKGWYFSVPTNITRLDHFKMLVGMVPLSLILTETDCPYLSPVVGKRNEPSNVAVTIKEISKIKGLSEEEVSERIFENAKRIFQF